MLLRSEPWDLTAGAVSADPGEVHVWWGHAGALAGRMPEPTRLLTAADLGHANALTHPDVRTRYLLSRGLIRLVLAQYMHADPREVPLAIGPNGKPCLGNEEDDRLAFNLAHSGDLVAMAVAGRTRAALGDASAGVTPRWSGEVGIDVERVRPATPIGEIASRFLAPSEVTALLQMPGPKRQRAFFELWVAKEAWLKATGEGLSRPLNTFSVELGRGDRWRLHGVMGRWTLVRLDACRGYVAAVAYGGVIRQLRSFDAKA